MPARNKRSTAIVAFELPKRRRLDAAAFDAQNEEDELADELNSVAASSHELSHGSPALLLDNVALSRLLQQQGAVLADGERWNAALAKFDEAVARDPSSSAAHEQRAQVLIHLDRFFEAVQAAQRSVERAPTWGDAHLTLARAQFNLGEPTLALDNAERAAALGCEDPQEAREEVEHIEAALLQAARATRGMKDAVEIALQQRSSLAPPAAMEDR
jgi:tetratricopeptide (TPR) repeat protein